MLLREIEVFRSVMSVGSASKAAALLGVTQPAISQSLRRLEEAAGFPLFRRLRGRLHPTPEAQALLAEVERVFVGLSSIEHRMRSLKRFGVNTLRMAVYPAFGLSFVPRVLSRLVAEHGDADARPQISLQVRSSREVHEAVLGRQVDFGLMADEMPTTGLEHSEFARFPGVVVMHAKHRLARARTIQPHQLADEPFLALNPEDASRRRLERALADCNVALSVLVETPYAASVCEMALSGMGIGVVNPITALEYAQRGLAVRPLSLEISFAGVLVLPPGQPLSGLAVRVLQLMRIQLAEDQKALANLLKPRAKG